MKIYNLLFYYSFLLLFMACNSSHNTKTDYTLHPKSEYKTFSLDENTYLPYNGIVFYSENGKEFIAFANRDIPEILIYDVKKQSLYRKIEYQIEGPNSIQGKLNDFFIKDLDNIYITTAAIPTIYSMDNNGNIKQKIIFEKADNEDFLVPKLQELGPITIINNKIYIPQFNNIYYNTDMMEKSRLGIVIDTVQHTIHLLPAKFPPLISYNDIGTSAGFGARYSRCFDGTHFIYSFNFSDLIYRTLPDHELIEEFTIKSKYIDKTEVFRTKTSNMQQLFKEDCEHPHYKHILYDKYREVFYLIAHPRTEVEAGVNYLELLRGGRKQFSIIILNKDMEIIGETLFPEYTYNPYLHFINEDGLYLSTNHIKNPEFSDEELRFEKIVLVGN